MTTVTGQLVMAAAFLTVGAGSLAAQARPSASPAPAAAPAAAPVPRPDGIVGDWVWAAWSGGESAGEGTMRVVRNGASLAGSVVMPQGEVPLITITFENRLLRFTMQGPNGVIRAEGELARDGTMSGTWSDDAGGSGTWVASRRQ